MSNCFKAFSKITKNSFRAIKYMKSRAAIKSMKSCAYFNYSVYLVVFEARLWEDRENYCLAHFHTNGSSKELVVFFGNLIFTEGCFCCFHFRSATFLSPLICGGSVDAVVRVQCTCSRSTAMGDNPLPGHTATPKWPTR